MSRGESPWFHNEEGLNDEGYIPGAPGDHPSSLPKNVVSEAMCADRSGPRSSGSFWYAKPGRSESPRQIYRIEKLYQLTHQRPMEKQKFFGLAFGRSSLGHALNWASFAAKTCARGRKPFETLEEHMRRIKSDPYWCPSNDAVDVNLDENTLEGAEDDWSVNRNMRSLDKRLVRGYNLKHALPVYPASTVEAPTYKGNVGGAGMKLIVLYIVVTSDLLTASSFYFIFNV